jgi:hypothetical protein
VAEAAAAARAALTGQARRERNAPPAAHLAAVDLAAGPVEEAHPGARGRRRLAVMAALPLMQRRAAQGGRLGSLAAQARMVRAAEAAAPFKAAALWLAQAVLAALASNWVAEPSGLAAAGAAAGPTVQERVRAAQAMAVLAASMALAAGAAAIQVGRARSRETAVMALLA